MIFRVILPSWSIGFAFAAILAVQSIIKPATVLSVKNESEVQRQTVVGVSCGVIDRPLAIYTSIVALVPLVLTLVANCLSINILRKRLKKRERLAKLRSISNFNVNATEHRPSLTYSDNDVNSDTGRDSCDIDEEWCLWKVPILGSFLRKIRRNIDIFLVVSFQTFQRT